MVPKLHNYSKKIKDKKFFKVKINSLPVILKSYQIKIILNLVKSFQIVEEKIVLIQVNSKKKIKIYFYQKPIFMNPLMLKCHKLNYAHIIHEAITLYLKKIIKR